MRSNFLLSDPNSASVKNTIFPSVRINKVNGNVRVFYGVGRIEHKVRTRLPTGFIKSLP